MMFIQMTSIDRMLKFTRGQGHKAKDQGQVCKFVKPCFNGYHEAMVEYYDTNTHNLYHYINPVSWWVKQHLIIIKYFPLRSCLPP